MAKIALILLIIIPTIACTQTTISGTIVDSISNEEVPYITVTLESIDGNVHAFTTSNDNGSYVLKTDSVGEFRMHFYSLVYQHKSISIEVSKESQDKIIDIELSEQNNTIEEILIVGEIAIAEREDTVIFDASVFSTGEEVVVEDLLRKLPGVSVDDEGTVKIEGVEIEKLMVDGDDFFEKGYKILSKNLPVHPIDKIEVLKNFSSNHLLKGIERSDKVAINLTLDEKSKRVWFGNINAGYGNENFYKLIGNLANFGISNKYYFLTNVNNIGLDATGEVDYLIRPQRDEGSAEIGDNQHVKNAIRLASGDTNFKKGRTNFNDARLVSINAIFNPTNKIKIKTLGFFNWDENLFYKNSLEEVNVNGLKFTNTEKFETTNQKKIAFGNLDLIYNLSKTQLLQYTAKVNSSSFVDGSNLTFNESSVSENLVHSNSLIDHKINFTQQLNSKNVLLLKARLINEESPQNYSINRFFYQELFPLTDGANNVLQVSDNAMQFGGLEAQLLRRVSKNDLLDFRMGTEHRLDVLETKFSLLDKDNIIPTSEGFENHLEYQVNDLYLKGEYQYAIQDLAIIGKVHLHQLYNSHQALDKSEKENAFFVNPSLGIDWTINESNRLISNFSHNTTNASALRIYDDYILTGFRSFSRGSGSFNQLESSSFFIKYELGNWKKRFFANTVFRYGKDHTFFSTNSEVNKNFVLSDRIIIDDRETIFTSSEAEYFFKSIKSTLKFSGSYSISEYKNIVNGSELRNVNSSHMQLGVDLRSGFKHGFNFHIGSKWIQNKFDSSSKNVANHTISFCDLYFVFNKKIDAQIQSERYNFSNLDDDNAYYFLDLKIRFKIKKDRIDLSFAGKNLFNTAYFRNYSVTDIGSSVTEIRLLPLHVLLSVEYKF